MKVPLLDLQAQYKTIQAELESAALKSLAQCHYIMGPEVSEFEKAIQKYCDVQHAIGCANGSDALRLALMAADIGPGDEVIIPTYTFFATAGAVALVGATPVFCDIELDYFNLDISRLERHITSRTKAIIPVHLFGQMADMDPIMELARKHRLVVIEDGAQAIGSEYKKKKMGGVGHMATLSFFPSKNLGCAGDGGMVLTNDAPFAEKLKILRVHGSKPKYYHQIIGFNSRLDTVQAAILQVKLKHLDSWSEARAKNAAYYTEKLAGLEKRECVRTPRVAPFTNRHVYNQYVLTVKNRDGLKDHLVKAGVGTEVYYPLSLHQQKCFEYLKPDMSLFPNAERAAASTLAIPIYSELTREQQNYVVETVEGFYK